MAETPRIILHNDQTEGFSQKLLGSFADARFQECNSYQDLPDMVASYRPDIVYTVRFAGSAGYPRDALFASGGPRWIANGGAGTDHFGHWDPSRITVTNAAGVASDMMAEYVIGSFLHFTLDIPGMQADKSTRVWRARRVRPLKGKTILVIGLGHTGRAVAALAKAFGMNVIGTRAHPQPTQNVDEVCAASELQTLLPRADFIVISTPLTPKTKGLIGKSEIALMMPGVILADVSRGGVVDQSALHKALESGQVAGASLDVFETEPLPDNSPLWQVKSLIISPHCSSVFDGWEEASFDMFLENLTRWINGQDLLNIVDPRSGY
jgi:phosphoglycerate dehydrogenase-like enzyme